ncbi:hypothetical protein NWQ33_06630 [Mycoplasmopsis cynos]|nr:hypothetical protein [Mycoplasmopsis cynos]
MNQKTEATIQNEQSSWKASTTPELKAIIDKENANWWIKFIKTSAIEELNKYKEEVQTAIETITDKTKKEELKKKLKLQIHIDLKTIKDKIESKSSEQTKNDGSSNQGKNEDSTGKILMEKLNKKDKENEGWIKNQKMEKNKPSWNDTRTKSNITISRNW